jgi:Ca2+-binding EF-hand superfamily protein
MKLSGKANLAKEQELQENARNLCNSTHFNESESLAILKLHSNLVSEVPLDRMQFRGLLFQSLEISDSFILDRIFRVVDENDDGVIDGPEFVKCLSTMMRGSLEELTSFCYDVYDVNGDRSLAREELFMCLDGSVRPGRKILEKEEVSDAVKDLVEMTMKKLDVNGDGQITYDDFQEAIQKDPLLIQVCGKCLPPLCYTRAFLYLVTADDKKIARILPPESTTKSRKTRSKASQMSVRNAP